MHLYKGPEVKQTHKARFSKQVNVCVCVCVYVCVCDRRSGLVLIREMAERYKR